VFVVSGYGVWVDSFICIDGELGELILWFLVWDEYNGDRCVGKCIDGAGGFWCSDSWLDEVQW